MLALDYRGHGHSQYDRNPNNYTIRVALSDLSAVLAALEITSAIFVGTSFGGVLAMMLAVLPPIAVAGVILNDIGPVIEPRGLVRIKQYVGKLPVPRTLEEGAEILRWWFNAQFPKLAPQDWIAFAQRTWREHRGALTPNPAYGYPRRRRKFLHLAAGAAALPAMSRFPWAQGAPSSAE